MPYSAVNLDNLAVTTASTAVTNGQVDAAVISQPLTGLDTATGKVRVLATGAGLLQTIGYLTASTAALANPQKAAALTDFIGRFYKASAALAKEPGLAAATYAKTYGVPLAVAKQAAASAAVQGHARSRRPSSATSRTRPTRSRSWASSRHISTSGRLRPPVQQGGLECRRTPVVRRQPR